jgi:uncharacterized protein (TIGR02452 family)
VEEAAERAAAALSASSSRPYERAKVLTLAEIGDVTAPTSPDQGASSPLSTRTATPTGNSGPLLRAPITLYSVGDDRGRFVRDPERPSDPFTWIRRANDEADREARRKGCGATVAACEKKGYQLPGRSVILSLDQQTNVILADEENLAPLSGAVTNSSSWMIANRETVLAGAQRALKDGFTKVAIVSAASAYHCGGGFSTGGRHALEEALCTCSTLFASLNPASAAVEDEKRNSGPYIPENGVILSEGVEFFRGETGDGYPFLDEKWVAAVISVAMPNLNASVRDSPVADFKSAAEYESAIWAKWRAVMVAADRSKAEALCICDAGCGVFHNDASTVGKLLGKTLRSRPNGLKQVYICAFSKDFTAGVEDGLSLD